VTAKRHILPLAFAMLQGAEDAKSTPWQYAWRVHHAVWEHEQLSHTHKRKHAIIDSNARLRDCHREAIQRKLTATAKTPRESECIQNGLLTHFSTAS